MSERKLYLAYGSNLSHRIMWQRCPAAIPLHKLLLVDVRLVFRGVADLQYEPGHRAPAGLWEIDADDEKRLDAVEGVALKRYGKYHLKLKGGENALVYIMNDCGIYPPDAWYMSKLRDGYRNFGLEETFLDEAVAHSYTHKDPTPEMVRRRAKLKLTGYRRNLVKVPESLATKWVEKRRKR
jgi:gamma-glutamylcyclotransferase